MKIAVAPQDVAIHGNFKTSDFNVGDVAFIVDMFADKVYTHKERAVIRELACNAYDSHVIAGTKDTSFNVHLPTALEPWFSVRDFGTGLSDHEVRTVFAGIGISTKRNNNDVIGCFGIGSLSPYSLTDCFAVISYHNGVARSYTCYRDEQRKPVVALLSENVTSEPNGLEISLSINGRVKQFEDEAVNVFRFWEGVLPNINNKDVVKQCEKERESFIFKGDDFGLSTSYGHMSAIMGNIAYRIPDEISEIQCDGYLKFNIGELEFDTARENLSMTDKVRKAIKDKFQNVKTKISKIAIDQIESLPTKFEQAVLADKLNRGQLGRMLKIKFENYALPEPKESFDYWQAKYRGCEKYYSKHIPIGDRVKYYIHKDRMTSRIKNYLKDVGQGHTMVIFKSKAQADECCIPDHLLNDLENLPKVQRNTVSRVSVNSVKTYQLNNYSSYRCRDNWEEVELDLNQQEIVYVEISNWYMQNTQIASNFYNLREIITRCNDVGITFPEIFGLKTSFFKSKEFNCANFISIDNFILREVQKLLPKQRVNYDKDRAEYLNNLHKLIQQDEIDAIKKLLPSKNNQKIMELANVCKYEVPESTDNTLDKMITEFFDKYCMLELIDSYFMTKNKSTIAKYLNGTVR